MASSTEPSGICERSQDGARQKGSGVWLLMILTVGLAPHAACELLCAMSVARDEPSVVVVDFREVGPRGCDLRS
jgi:hypothetical protein